MEQQPSYYSILPANVRYDKDLSANEKLLYSEITALCGKTGECWATNKYFAKLYGVADRTISTWVSHLVAKGYLEIHMNKDGNERKLCLSSVPHDENIVAPHDENIHHNIINPEQYLTPTDSPKGENQAEVDSAIANFEESWNTQLREYCPRIPKVLIMTDVRKRHLKARLKEAAKHMKARGIDKDLLTYFLRDIVYDRYTHSQFLQGQLPGRNGIEPFRFDINYVLDPGFFTKMLEYRYDDRPQYRNLV